MTNRSHKPYLSSRPPTRRLVWLLPALMLGGCGGLPIKAVIPLVFTLLFSLGTYVAEKGAGLTIERWLDQVFWPEERESAVQAIRPDPQDPLVGYSTAALRFSVVGPSRAGQPSETAQVSVQPHEARFHREAVGSTWQPDAATSALITERLQVAQVQLALRYYGFDPGRPDGLLGPRTRTALQAFQTRYRIDDPPGVLGAATLEALLDEY